MNGNRIPDYEIADIVPGYTGFTQDVKTQQQKQTAGEKANGGGSVSQYLGNSLCARKHTLSQIQHQQRKKAKNLYTKFSNLTLY